MQAIKCVVVGDGGVGKTSLLMSYTAKTFPNEYVPTIFDNYNSPITLGDKTYNLGLWDTAGQEEYDKMRTVSYPHTDVFVLCFSLVQPNSFLNLKNRWFPELKEYCPTTPILLVGTKLDLTTDDATMRALARANLAPINRDQALKAMEELNLSGYLECSGLTQTGVKVVFEEAARLAVGLPLTAARDQNPNTKKSSKQTSRLVKTDSRRVLQNKDPKTRSKCNLL